MLGEFKARIISINVSTEDDSRTYSYEVRYSGMGRFDGTNCIINRSLDGTNGYDSLTCLENVLTVKVRHANKGLDQINSKQEFKDLEAFFEAAYWEGIEVMSNRPAQKAAA